MLLCLTKAKRLKAGWLLAVAYMLCILAPGISFAFSNGGRAAPCLSEEGHVVGIVHVHDVSVGQHIDTDGYTDAHSAMHGKSAFQGDHDDVQAAADVQKPSPGHGEHNAPNVQCCGMVCLSALPATIVDLVEPSVPASICASENYRSIADNTPPTLYRPPIS